MHNTLIFLTEFDPRNLAPSIIARLNTRFQKIVSDAVSPLGLNVPEWRVLICLVKSESCIVNDIVDYTHLPQSSVSRALSHLHTKGLITRGWNKADNRIADLGLTAHGFDTCEAAARAITAGTEEMLSRLNYEKIDKWLKMSSEILALLDKDKKPRKRPAKSV